MKRGRFRWSTFALACLLSLALHVGYVIPRMFAPLLEKPEVPLEVSYAPDVGSTPSESAPPEKPEPEAPEPKKSEPPKPERRRAEAEPPPPATVPPPQVAKVEPPKTVPPPPVAPPPPPQVSPRDHRMQMVDQDRAEDEADNPDAHYLAQKNHRAEKETSAKNTNLIREVQSKNQATSEPNQNQSEEVGAKNDKIAELEDRRGADKSLPRSSPMQGEEGSATDPGKTGPLSMRNLTPRSEVKAVPGEAAREGVELKEKGPGDLPMARIGHDQVRGQAAQKGGKIKLQLDHHNYDNIEGFGTAEKERRDAARAESSHKKGRYDRFLAKAQAMRSSIENFTPEVRPGNQSELGTRRDPFAGYITSMHRQIHKLWTFGFLADIDGKPSSSSAYANMELWTQLEIVLKGDGVVDKVTIVRGSGVLAFDVAAIDSVMSASPFPSPPREIRSANGKVYMDWQFHRDERACGTFGVDPYILTTPGDSVHHDTSETGAEAKARMKAAESEGGSGASPNRSAALEGLRTLERTPRTREERPESPAATAHATPPPVLTVPEVTDEVRTAADGWFASYARGDASWLAGWSATPFTAAGDVVARDADKLKTMYRQLLSENSGPRTKGAVEVLTPAGIRGRLGGLPPGGEESGMLYAIGKGGREEFILLLKKSTQGWRVCGIDR